MTARAAPSTPPGSLTMFIAVDVILLLCALALLVPFLLAIRGWVTGREYRPKRSDLPPLPVAVRGDESSAFDPRNQTTSAS